MNQIVVFLNCLENVIMDGVMVVAQTHNLLCVHFLTGHDKTQKLVEHTVFDQQKIIELQ